MKQAVTRDYDFHKMAEMVRTRIEVFPDIPEMLDFLKKCRSMTALCTYTKK